MEKVSVFTSLTSMVEEHGWAVRIAAQGTCYSATAYNQSLPDRKSVSATGATVSITLSNLYDKVMERENAI